MTTKQLKPRPRRMNARVGDSLRLVDGKTEGYRIVEVHESSFIIELTRHGLLNVPRQSPLWEVVSAKKHGGRG